MKNCPLKNELLRSLTGAAGTHSAPGDHSVTGAHSASGDAEKIGAVYCSNGAVCCAFLALKILTESDEELREDLRRVMK